MYKTYLVTGATGFLGRTVVSELLSRGAAVRALVLPGDRLAGVLPESVERTEGDICSASALENFFAGTDESTCVIHTAGIVTVASRPDASLYRVNVDGTRAILRECAAHGVGKLVYISSVHALPEKPKGMTITETDAVSSEFVSGDYAKSKAEATSLVFAAAKNGLNASIVFPSGIIGPGDIAGGSMTTMFRSFLAGRLPLAVRGGYDFVDVRDVARRHRRLRGERAARLRLHSLRPLYNDPRYARSAQIRSRCTAHGNISAAQACPERGEGLREIYP